VPLLKLNQEDHPENSQTLHQLEELAPKQIHQYQRYTLKNITKLPLSQAPITELCKHSKATINQDQAAAPLRQGDNYPTLIKGLIGKTKT
tara:strand:+ start:2349 stop:2618 length:270 start_codon:yes stop_codon:yes gene_type:complete